MKAKEHKFQSYFYSSKVGRHKIFHRKAIQIHILAFFRIVLEDFDNTHQYIHSDYWLKLHNVRIWGQECIFHFQHSIQSSICSYFYGHNRHFLRIFYDKLHLLRQFLKRRYNFHMKIPSFLHKALCIHSF